VRDTGIGIPPDKQALIFQAFTQQDTSTTRKYGGTGLGLTIASRLASLMSGTISVSSELGCGSTFIFTASFGVSGELASIRSRAGSVAARAVSLSTAVTEAPAFAPKLRVLVAEDNEFNADLIRQLLQRRGHEVRLASNGTDAIALARSRAFDLMLLDLHMPGMDGFEVITRLREEEGGTGDHLPVVALTARARVEDRERCLAAGMDDFLAKPVHAEALWSAIRRVTSAAPSVIDATLLRAACGDDTAVLDSLCQSLRSHLPRELHLIEEAVHRRDLAAVREAAHRLAGMISAVSTAAGSTASALEDEAALGDFVEVATLFERLARQTNAIVEVLGSVSAQGASSR
jgi:CheY-like chemotaxis protein